jgi:hypothetical protein
MSEAIKITLCDYANEREYVVMFWVGFGNPTGDYAVIGHPDLDFAERRGLLELIGIVDEDGEWFWDGKGDPRDDRRNSITQVSAISNQAKWQSIVEEWESEDGVDDVSDEDPDDDLDDIESQQGKDDVMEMILDVLKDEKRNDRFLLLKDGEFFTSVEKPEFQVKSPESPACVYIPIPADCSEEELVTIAERLINQCDLIDDGE